MRQVLTKFPAAFLNGRMGSLLLMRLPSMRKRLYPDTYDCHALAVLPGNVVQSEGASICPLPAR